jgi:hypothetical protein
MENFDRNQLSDEDYDAIDFKYKSLIEHVEDRFKLEGGYFVIEKVL